MKIQEYTAVKDLLFEPVHMPSPRGFSRRYVYFRGVMTKFYVDVVWSEVCSNIGFVKSLLLMSVELGHESCQRRRRRMIITESRIDVAANSHQNAEMRIVCQAVSLAGTSCISGYGTGTVCVVLM